MRTTIHTGSHPHGAWLLATRPSAPALRHLVREYVGYAEWSAGAVRRLQVPHPGVTLIINLGAPLRVGRVERAPDAVAPSFGSFVAGVHDTAVITDNTGPSSGIELNLSPLGAWALLQTPMALLANRVLSLEDVLGHPARELQALLLDHSSPDGAALDDSLAGVARWDARFDLVDVALLHRLGSTTRAPGEVQWAWSQLASPQARRPVGDITRELGGAHPEDREPNRALGPRRECGAFGASDLAVATCGRVRLRGSGASDAGVPSLRGAHAVDVATPCSPRRGRNLTGVIRYP